jgi:hypothetical protein
MKRSAILLIPLLVLTFSLSAQHAKLSDAIQKGLIRLHIMGNGHTGQCASVQAENLSAETLDLDLDCGQKIVNSDTLQQNLMVTRKESFHLLPKGKATRQVYAMCINAGKGSPASKAFNLGQMAQGTLLRLAKLIEFKGWQNSNAQSAIWAITDNRTVNTIGSDITDDYEMVNALRDFVAKEKKITNYTKAKKKVRTEKMIDGSVDVILDKKANVAVYIIDKDGKIMKRMMQENKDAGIVRVNYSVRNLDYASGLYYIVVKVNDKESKRELIMLE